MQSCKFGEPVKSKGDPQDPHSHNKKRVTHNKELQSICSDLKIHTEPSREPKKGTHW